MCDVVYDVFENHHLVSLLHQCAELGTDFTLAGGCHLVVMDFRFDTHVVERKTHCRTKIVQRIHRGHREVTAFHRGAMTGVRVLAAASPIPGTFVGVHLVECAVHRVVPGHVVEHEEFVLRSEVRGIRNTGGLEIGLGAFGERARAAIVALHRGRLDHVATQVQGCLFGKEIDDGGRRIRHQDHVGLIDALPARDRGAVEHFPVLEQVLIDRSRGHADMLFLSFRVRETEVDELDLLILNEGEYLCGLHGASSDYWFMSVRPVPTRVWVALKCRFCAKMVLTLTS